MPFKNPIKPLPFVSAVDGIKKSLLNHSELLDSLIEAFTKSDMSAASSLNDFVAKFEDLRKQVESAGETALAKVQTELDLMATAASNPISKPIAIKIGIPIKGPLAKFLVEAIAIINLASLIGYIVLQYVVLITLIAKKIVESLETVVKLGLEAAAKFLAGLSQAIWEFIQEAKKQALAYVKKQVREEFIAKRETTRNALVATTLAGYTPELDDAQLDAVRDKIKSIDKQIIWLKLVLKDDAPTTFGIGA